MMRDSAPRHHPGIERYLERRTRDWQARVADAITAFAGSMAFVYLHVLAFAAWMLWVETDPWPKLTLVVSLEAIFLSTFVLIGQNRQADVTRAKADHDFVEQELELKSNTDLTRAVLTLVRELDARLPGADQAASPRPDEAAVATPEGAGADSPAWPAAGGPGRSGRSHLRQEP